MSEQVTGPFTHTVHICPPGQPFPSPNTGRMRFEVKPKLIGTSRKKLSKKNGVLSQ
jgi:hypothetical protein